MLFRLSEVHKSYGVQDVLRGASLQVNAGEHVGLVGRNGAGKRTIFRLVRGEESADRGDVVRSRNVKLGLLDQHVHFEPGRRSTSRRWPHLVVCNRSSTRCTSWSIAWQTPATTWKKFSSATAICNTSSNTKVVLNIAARAEAIWGLRI